MQGRSEFFSLLFFVAHKTLNNVEALFRIPHTSDSGEADDVEFL